MKKKTFLVTGGSGFIGSNISELLLKLNYKVIVVIIIQKQKYFIFIKYKNCKLIKGDINKNVESYSKLDAVMHLAYIGTKYFILNLISFRCSNQS